MHPCFNEIYMMDYKCVNYKFLYHCSLEPFVKAEAALYRVSFVHQKMHGNALMVRRFVLEHNHILSKVCIDCIIVSALISKHWDLTYDWKLSFLL